MKLVSWNVNGLRAIVGKGFAEVFKSFDADFFCLQEIKLHAGQIELEFDGYEAYYSYADKKGYSGTAIFSKHHPLSVKTNMDIDRHDHEGRIVALEFNNYYIVTVYTPNSQSELARLDYRMDWEYEFRNFLISLDNNKPVIVCGDMNVAHQEIDLANPKSNRMNAGFTDQERQCMTELLEAGFTDTFRALHPEQIGAYSWWSYRGHAREKNVGWRIDYFLTSDRLRDKIIAANIHPDITGSDHCPVSLDIEI